MFRALPVGLLLAVVSGCGNNVQQEYVWTRSDPAAGRSSATTFVVRISIDRNSKSVVWFEDAHDKDGEFPLHTETWKDCSFLDNENWQCAIPGVPDQIEMKNGHLRQEYWGEKRDFVGRRTLLGVLHY